MKINTNEVKVSTNEGNTNEVGGMKMNNNRKPDVALQIGKPVYLSGTTMSMQAWHQNYRGITRYTIQYLREMTKEELDARTEKQIAANITHKTQVLLKVTSEDLTLAQSESFWESWLSFHQLTRASRDKLIANPSSAKSKQHTWVASVLSKYINIKSAQSKLSQMDLDEFSY